MKTRQDIENLKQNWVYDPCWDIEATDGFEEYYDELLAYREQKEIEWNEKYNAELMQHSEKLGISGNLILAEKIRSMERELHKLRENYG